jgi:hypothetical protein
MLPDWGTGYSLGKRGPWRSKVMNHYLLDGCLFCAKEPLWKGSSWDKLDDGGQGEWSGVVFGVAVKPCR